MRWFSITTILILTSAAPLAAVDDPASRALTNPFFAFDNGTGRGELPPRQQAAMLKELGYAGIGYTGTANIPEMLAALDAEGLKMFSTYVGADVDDADKPYDPGLPKAIEQFKGRETVIWLTLQGGTPSSDQRDAAAVAIIRAVAEMAAESNLRVALYPHAGFYVARTEDALRLIEKADRPNVGASLNLCHFLKLDEQKNLEPLLQKALPRLFLVSINGADAGQTRAMGWDRLIQTLDRGSLDVYEVLRALRRRGYDGPIGLQCYNIQGERRENLKRSIEAWHGFVERMSTAGKAAR
jgi:sugar phosphate isomerase/epimerase